MFMVFIFVAFIGRWMSNEVGGEGSVSKTYVSKPWTEGLLHSFHVHEFRFKIVNIIMVLIL